MKSTTRQRSHRDDPYSFGFGLYIYKRVGRKKVLVYSNPEDPPARAWIDFLYTHTRAADLPAFTSPDIAGTSRTVNYNMQGSTLAAVGETNRGIVLGRGSAPPDLSQYCLGSLVAHGTGSGQLYYKVEDMTPPIYAQGGPKQGLRYLHNVRAVENRHTAPLLVFEVGLYIFSLSYSQSWMFARDVIADGILFEPGDEYFFNYRMEIPLP